MSKIEYAYFRFKPYYKKEINFLLGVLIFDKENNQKEFRYRIDLDELEVLDEDLDKNIMLKLLEGIAHEIEFWDKYNKKEFDLRDYIKYFINDFNFSEIQYTDDIGEIKLCSN